MKTYKKTVCIILILVFSILFCACAKNTNDERQLLRLHIRANSNSLVDQQVKLKVRDIVVSYLDTQLGHLDSYEKVKKEITKLLPQIQSKANKVLAECNMDYKAKAKLDNQYFPTRMYEDLVVESGYYDALIIELGSGQGDNWWCVIYPPLCYVEVQFGSGFRYKSKIKELIDKYFG